MTHAFNGELRAEVLAGRGVERRLAASVPDQAASLFHTGEPNAAQMELINRLSLRDLRADELFAWPIQAVNNLTFAYSMWMDRTSLDNFAEDANGPRGIPYLRNHRSDQDPHGRVFAAVLVEDGKIGAADVADGAVPHARDLFRDRKGESVLRLYEMVFMPRGLTINGSPNDDLIRNLESGVQASNSIGFHTYGPLEPGSYIECDICGVDMFRAGMDACRHFPGLEYEEQLAEDSDDKAVVLSTARVVGARQSEVSGVYLGAVPETYTERAGQLYRAGHMSSKDARRLEERLALGRGRIVGDVRTYHQTGAVVAPRSTEPTEPPSGGTQDKGDSTMADTLARVRELVAGDAALWADLELQGVEDDPVRALVEHHKAEVARIHDELSDTQEAHKAFKTKIAERLGQAEDETLESALARLEAERKVAGEVRDRLVAEYLRQLTRAGMPADEDEERELIAPWSLAQIEKKTKQLKAKADASVTPGMVHEPEVASRHGDGDTNDDSPLTPVARPVAARY